MIVIVNKQFYLAPVFIHFGRPASLFESDQMGFLRPFHKAPATPPDIRLHSTSLHNSSHCQSAERSSATSELKL